MAENFFWHYKCECIRLRKKSVHSFEKFVEVMEEYLNFYNKEPYQRRLYISLKIDHLTGNIRPPSRSGKTILTSVKAAY